MICYQVLCWGGGWSWEGGYCKVIRTGNVFLQSDGFHGGFEIGLKGGWVRVCYGWTDLLKYRRELDRVVWR